MISAEKLQNCLWQPGSQPLPHQGMRWEGGAGAGGWGAGNPASPAAGPKLGLGTQPAVGCTEGRCCSVKADAHE